MLMLVCWTLPAFSHAAAPRSVSVTAVTGESWLDYLHRSFGDTSMGKTWRLGPLQPTPVSAGLSSTGSPRSSAPLVTLHGADLYRLNCQGCHGPAGLGTPPEIPSLIDPIRATSAALVTKRMKNAGATLSHKQIAEMVIQAQTALLKRLHEGGQDMPSFQHLSIPEIRSLIAYLNLLADIPSSEHKQIAVQETPDRVGELVVKSTCHTCHGATGANTTTSELLQGRIPPLSTLPVRVTRSQMVQKVTSGAAVPMSSADEVFRGRMPVLDYLAADEASDVYEYLERYPPVEAASLARVSAVVAATVPGPPPAVDRESVTRSLLAASTLPGQALQSNKAPLSFTWPLLFAGLFTLLLVALGGWITLTEFARLDAKNQSLGVVARLPAYATVAAGSVPAEMCNGSNHVKVETWNGGSSFGAAARRKIS